MGFLWRRWESNPRKVPAVAVALVGLAFTPTAQARVVYLTFDDGPGRYTAQVLRILHRFDARATFFVCGQRVAIHPRVTQRIARAGHRIGNHSWSHPDLTQTAFSDELDEFRWTQQLVAALTSRAPTLMRPPFGEYDAETEAVNARLGLSMVGWDVSSADWDERMSSRDIVRWTLAGVDAGGSVVLLHDSGYRAETVEALPRIMRGLRARGYTFRRLPERREFRVFTDDPPATG